MFNPDLSVRAFRDFAASKDPNDTYNYLDHKNCGIAQFVQAQGWPTAQASGSSVRPGVGIYKVKTSDELEEAAGGRATGSFTQTWGDVVKRCDKILAREPVQS